MKEGEEKEEGEEEEDLRRSDGQGQLWFMLSKLVAPAKARIHVEHRTGRRGEEDVYTRFSHALSCSSSAPHEVVHCHGCSPSACKGLATWE